MKANAGQGKSQPRLTIKNNAKIHELIFQHRHRIIYVRVNITGLSRNSYQQMLSEELPEKNEE